MGRSPRRFSRSPRRSSRSPRRTSRSPRRSSRSPLRDDYRRGDAAPGDKRSRDDRHYRDRDVSVLGLAPNRRSGVLTQASSEEWAIPKTAPRIEVPQLPLEVCAFLDFVATHTAVGGPLFNDELRAREHDNPFFTFLFAGWRDPVSMYYRWRVYAFLQGDTALNWRQEPFQMEQGANRLVWVPPRVLPSGVGWMHKRPQSYVIVPSPIPLDSSYDGPPDPALVARQKLEAFVQAIESTEGSTAGLVFAYPRDELSRGVGTRSAFWIARQQLQEENTLFSCLVKADEATWCEMLDTKTQVRRFIAQHVQTPGLQRPLNPPVGALLNAPARLFALYSRMLLLEDGASSPSQDVVLRTLEAFQTRVLQPSLLRRDAIGERMVFALQHSRTPHHVLSCILDEVASLSHLPLDLFRVWAELANNPGDVLLEKVDAVRHRIVAMHTYGLLQMLFILNDVGHSVCGGARVDATDIAASACSNKAVPGFGLRPVPLRNHCKAFECILMPLIEGILRYGVTVMEICASSQVPTQAEGNEGGCVFKQAASTLAGALEGSVDVQLITRLHLIGSDATADSATNCELVVALLEWLRELLNHWHQKDFISLRRWSHLRTRYAAFLPEGDAVMGGTVGGP